MTGLARTNRRTVARRTGWPAGALAECERLDDVHPGWLAWWLPENRARGWERPAGFSAARNTGGLVGGNELRREPEDGVRRTPNVFGPGIDELAGRIAAAEARIAAQEADREWLNQCLRGPIAVNPIR